MASTGIVQTLSADLGIPLDLLKTCLLLAISIPLSLLFKLINNPTLRYTYSLTLGIFYIFYLLEQWAFYVLLVALVPFLLFSFFKKYTFEISILTSIGFLMFIHTYRFIYDYMGWKIDCSVSVMFLVTRVVYYGNYATNHSAKISIFKYLSYCLFFPSVLIGPTFFYTSFQNFIQKTNGYENPKIKWNLTAKQILKMVIFSIATVKLMPIFTPYWALQNQWFQSLPPVLKFLSLNVIGVFYRIKFYSAWGFTQTAIDFSGLSWNEKQQNYSSVKTGSPRFETEINPRNKTIYWNTSIQNWLKQMIFDKVVSRTKSSGLATFVTFLTSALWHGVYLTYYVGFVQWAIIIIISKWGYKMAQSMPEISHNVFAKIIAFLVGSSLLNYTGMFIVVLTWNQALQCYKDMHFIGNVMMFALLVASFVIKPRKHRHKHHKQEGTQSEKQESQEVEKKQ